MQTYLPYPSVQHSVQCLETSDLLDQASVTFSILSGRGRTLPAARMWKGYSQALNLYHNEVVREYVRRTGSSDYPTFQVGEVTLPPWFGSPSIHASHRSNLLRKNPDWYGQFGWSESPNLEFVWPDTNLSPESLFSMFE